MESAPAKRPSHKEWRRQAKKERRSRVRSRAAREREQEAERLQKVLEGSDHYRRWSQRQLELEQQRDKREQEEHALLEKAWLEAEEKAQKEWKVLQERKAKARELQLAQEEIIRKEFEEMQETTRKRKEAERRRREDQKKLFDRLKKEIDAYIDDEARTPKQLRAINETQPGKEVCPFFNKTGACRYGDICSRNHQRPSLSKVVLVPNFYTHFSLERHRDEYDSDVRLEYDHRETRSHFRDFYFDVVPELEKFGKIRTLQYCKNTESHLRGNLYVEYQTEREAARALRGLKGRWYAGRQLHCEFVNLKSWRGAICGMVRCPKGSACNFLHTFRNPTEDYGVKSPPLWQKRQEQFNEKPGSARRDGSSRKNWEEYENQDRNNKNWRWSESPEPDGRRGRDNRDNRQNNFRQPQRNFHQRNQFNNRGHFDNRRNDNRNFQNRNNYNNRFNDRNRFSNDDFDRPQRRQFNNDRFNNRRKYSDGDYEGRMKRKDRSRSRSRSPRYRTRSRSVSGSRSRSRSQSRSQSRSPSRSQSRSISRSRSRSRSRSPARRPATSAVRAEPSPQREPKRRPPSPVQGGRKSSTNPASKWDSEKREDSDRGSRDSRSRSVSPPPRYKPSEGESNSKKKPAPKKSSQHYSQPPPPGSKSKSGGQKEYEWDTTDSE